MPRQRRGGDLRPMQLEIRDAAGPELSAGSRLLAGCLGFGPRDAIPPWLIHDLQLAGGPALGAFVAGELAGFSLAVPARGESGPYLFSCGLAVAPSVRGRGIGLRLKAEQGERARERGYRVIRWGADPLNVAGLRLYLDRLGARVVGYDAEPYAGIRDDGPVAHDDVQIEWVLDGERPAGRVAGWVELTATNGGDATALRLSVREAMRQQLEAGAVGVGVGVDHAAARAWMRFEVPR